MKNGEKVEVPKRSVEINDNSVTKRSASHLMEIEVAKTKAACEIASSTGLFRVPNVIDFDISKGTAVFEYIADMASIRNAVFSRSKSQNIASRLGEIIATVHNQLRLPDSISHPLDEPLVSNSESVFIHGDLSLSNIGYINQSDEIVFLDWQTTAQFNPISTCASPYFDVAWLIRNLYLSPIPAVLIRDTITPVLREFLYSYQENCSVVFEAQTLWQYLLKMADSRDRNVMVQSSFPVRICQEVSKRRTWKFLGP